MRAYFVGAIDIADRSTYDRYRAATKPLLAGKDVEFLTADPDPLMFEGTKPANHIFIVRFGTAQALEDFYRSDGYQAIRHLRTDSSETRFLMMMRGAA